MKLANVRNSATPFDALDVKKDEVMALLDSVRNRAKNMYYSSAQKVDWGHVGSMAHVAELLNEVEQFLSAYPNEE